ncbi:MAG TPA: amidohydrolase family protein [Polyangiaceae bacterium]|nr:amidohydrolase family protein [Polyangiaceae bacterium]
MLPAVDVAIQSRKVLLRPAGSRLRLSEATLLIGGGRILRVHEGPPPPLRDTPVLDYGDGLITPAFVNPHTHLTMNFLRGRFADLTESDNAVEQLFFRAEALLEPADVRAFTRMGAYESLLAGVGLVWDHYYFGAAVAAALADVGLAGVVAPTLQDVHGPGAGQAERGLEETLQIAADARLAGAGVFAALGPHATDSVSPELWARLAQLAESAGLPLHFHLAQSPEELARVQARSGCSPVERLRRAGILERPRVMAHGIYLSLADARQASFGPDEAAARGWLVFCPTSQTQFGLPARIDEWLDADIPFVVASDSGNSNDGLSVQAELRWVAGYRALSASFGSGLGRLLANGAREGAELAGLERKRAVERRRALGDSDFLLRKVWDDAGALHPGFRAGVITEGALANLAVWNLEAPELWPATDPLRALAFSNLAHALRQLIVMGRPLGEDGAFASSLLRSAGYRDALREANARLEQLWRRAGG